MKVIILTACVFVCALAEPPPSKGYLPPSSRSAGASGSSYGDAPTFGGGAGTLPVVVARNGQPNGNNYQRSGAGHPHAHNSYESPVGRSAGYPGSGYQGAGYAGGFARNGADDNEPANYNFDYSVTEDGLGGAEFGHHEERQDERAAGQYHVVLPDGRKQVVSYQADENGFKPRISYEDTDLSRSGGYDSNSQSIGFAGRSGGYGNHGRSAGSHGFAGGRSSGY